MGEDDDPFLLHLVHDPEIVLPELRHHSDAEAQVRQRDGAIVHTSSSHPIPPVSHDDDVFCRVAYENQIEFRHVRLCHPSDFGYRPFHPFRRYSISPARGITRMPSSSRPFSASRSMLSGER